MRGLGRRLLLLLLGFTCAGVFLDRFHRVRIRFRNRALVPTSDLTLRMSSTGSFLILRTAYDVYLALNNDPLEPLVMDQIRRLGSPVREEPQHRRQECSNSICFVFREQVFVVQDRFKRPET